VSIPSFEDLLRTLAEKTAAGVVNWRPTAAEREFLVQLKDFSLSVRLSRQPEGADFAVIVIRDPSGRELDRSFVEEGDSNWKMVEAMHTSARRKALRVDHAIASMVREIEASPEVGLPVEPAPSPSVDPKGEGPLPKRRGSTHFGESRRLSARWWLKGLNSGSPSGAKTRPWGF
jgi:hypothetical protein